MGRSHSVKANPTVKLTHRAKPRRVITYDMYLSTLRSHIEAMGGELDIIARFPDVTVKISKFTELGSTTKATRLRLAQPCKSDGVLTVHSASSIALL